MDGASRSGAAPLLQPNQQPCYELSSVLERLRSQPANVEGTMKRAAFVCLLLGVLVCAGFSQTSGGSKNENLRNCFAGFGACDPSALTSDQAKQIADMRHDQNLWKCLEGYGECDHTALTSSEEKEVASAQHRRNLLACETIIGICDKSQLTASEAERVARY